MIIINAIVKTASGKPRPRRSWTWPRRRGYCPTPRRWRRSGPSWTISGPPPLPGGCCRLPPPTALGGGGGKREVSCPMAGSRFPPFCSNVRSGGLLLTPPAVCWAGAIGGGVMMVGLRSPPLLYSSVGFDQQPAPPPPPRGAVAGSWLCMGLDLPPPQGGGALVSETGPGSDALCGDCGDRGAGPAGWVGVGGGVGGRGMGVGVGDGPLRRCVEEMRAGIQAFRWGEETQADTHSKSGRGSSSFENRERRQGRVVSEG